MARTILSVKNLNVKFNGEEILNDINFEIKEKEVLAILGPNGAGKTTLLRTLLGLVDYEGEVSWAKKDFCYIPPKELFQRKELPPLSIEEFFKFKNVTKKQILEIIDSVGLDKSVLKKEFTNLSTGQFQRMIVAWALVDNPSILLFDEPTAGVDISGQETIYSLIHKFWEERTLTILLVTHDLGIVWSHASNALCLNKKVLHFGRPDKILTEKGMKELYGTNITFYKHHH